MKAQRKPSESKCAVCGKTEPGQLHFAGGGIFEAVWVQPPAGWWVLQLSGDKPHLRCPGCLPEPP